MNELTMFSVFIDHGGLNDDDSKHYRSLISPAYFLGYFGFRALSLRYLVMTTFKTCKYLKSLPKDIGSLNRFGSWRSRMVVFNRQA